MVYSRLGRTLRMILYSFGILEFHSLLSTVVCSGWNGFPVEGLEIVGQGFLVVLDREQVVRALFLDQEAGGLTLGVERIGGDHAPLDGEGIEQLPQGRDFVVLGLDRALGQDGALPREQTPLTLGKVLLVRYCRMRPPVSCSFSAYQADVIDPGLFTE